jgi:ribonucleoside-triphosphate reductase
MPATRLSGRFILKKSMFLIEGRTSMSTKCNERTEVYSRVCGFFRPVQQWNKGKKEEFKDRREYIVEDSHS